MKPIGIVRKIDKLGRVVIPKETRDMLGMKKGGSVEFFVEDECVCIKKYISGCIFCEGLDGLIEHNGQLVCSKCAETISKTNAALVKIQKPAKEAR